MPFESKEPTNMRQHRRNMERTLVIAVVLVLVVVGAVIIGAVYGWSSIFTALLCLLPGAGIFVLLWLVLNGLEFLVKDKD
jgi:protein-S-isoprenylcysteine O-methyltransferase Ste14